MKKKLELPIFIHRKPDGTEHIDSMDLTKGPGGKVDQYALDSVGVCVGRTMLVGEYEDIEADPTEILIERLEASLKQDIADSHVRQARIKDQIEKLRCLTHQADEGDV